VSSKCTISEQQDVTGYIRCAKTKLKFDSTFSLTKKKKRRCASKDTEPEVTTINPDDFQRQMQLSDDVYTVRDNIKTTFFSNTLNKIFTIKTKKAKFEKKKNELQIIHCLLF
jgi:hypothetical protein